MRQSGKLISREKLVKLLRYCPNSGKFTWRESRGNHVWAGMTAGTMLNGYVVIFVDGERYRAHRLAFLYQTGQWPKNLVDHIDGNPSNNRWSNLREATPKENGQNKKVGANNKSGYLGVGWHKSNRKWQASIKVSGKLRHLGYFDDPALASVAYVNAKASLHTFNPVVRG